VKGEHQTSTAIWTVKAEHSVVKADSAKKLVSAFNGTVQLNVSSI